LQEILCAQAKRSVLAVLRGLDTSGKDGTIRKVFSPLNPLGVNAAFKTPTPRELAHDFLWRIHKAMPPAGIIGNLQPIALRGCARSPGSRAGTARPDRSEIRSDQQL
jgi:polyphosphate kinase 2 (PPK2 family)